MFQLSMPHRFRDMLCKNLMSIMNSPDENAKIVKGRISVVLRDSDMKFWERSEKMIS